jgi:hypothetical protein
VRKNMHVRKINPHSMIETKAAELALQDKPGLDPLIFTYPATTILVAEDGTDKVFMPVQTCYIMETLGYKEGISNLSLAAAMKQFVSVLVWESGKSGFGELLFLGNNEETNKFAENNDFEELPYKCYRLKVPR